MRKKQKLSSLIHWWSHKKIAYIYNNSLQYWDNDQYKFKHQNFQSYIIPICQKNRIEEKSAFKPSMLPHSSAPDRGAPLEARGRGEELEELEEMWSSHEEMRSSWALGGGDDTTSGRGDGWGSCKRDMWDINAELRDINADSMLHGKVDIKSR